MQNFWHIPLYSRQLKDPQIFLATIVYFLEKFYIHFVEIIKSREIVRESSRRTLRVRNQMLLTSGYGLEFKS